MSCDELRAIGLSGTYSEHALDSLQLGFPFVEWEARLHIWANRNQVIESLSWRGFRLNALGFMQQQYHMMLWNPSITWIEG